MATAQELCHRLGFIEKSVEECSRGEPDALLSDIRNFAAKLTGKSDPAGTTYRYLHSQNRGSTQWPKDNNAELAQLLQWPRDAELITDLVMQLFTLQLHNNCTASAQATPGPAEKKVEHSHAKAQKMTVTPRVLSTAQNNAHVKDQREAGQVDASIISKNGPKPLLAGSVKELSKIIEAWIRSHHGERPPASLVFRKPDIKEHVIKDAQLTVGSGSGWVRRFQINYQWMAWMIEDKNGGCMLAKPTMKNCRSGFQAWLGGDRGFTPTPVAHIVKRENQPKIMDSELIDSEDDRSEGDDMNIASPPQLQSLTRIKRARAPIDYTVPDLLPPSTRSSDHVHQQPHIAKRRKTVRSSGSTLSPSPSVVSTSAVPSASRASYTVKRETAASPVSSRDPVVAMRLRGRALASSTESPADSVTVTTLASSPPISLGVASKITFHFFLSDADLGAIPQDFVHCNTYISFFNQALAAWKILNGEERNTVMTAVSVVLASVDWPIVIPWKNKDGFETMIGIVTKAAMEKGDHLDVKVKCMRQA